MLLIGIMGVSAAARFDFACIASQWRKFRTKATKHVAAAGPAGNRDPHPGGPPSGEGGPDDKRPRERVEVLISREAPGVVWGAAQRLRTSTFLPPETSPTPRTVGRTIRSSCTT